MTSDAGSSPVLAPILEISEVTKHFQGTRALHSVSLKLQSGRLLALLGANGAGKSTLMNIAAGALRPDKGRLIVNGQTVNIRSPRDANRLGISTIYQELSLASNLSVAENIFLGREPRTKMGLVDYGRMNRETASLLERLDPRIPAQTEAGTLRVGQQQIVEIARALSMRTRILIMDEPTSALSQQETTSLMGVVMDLKRDGVGIIYITHKLEELEAIADDIAIMRDGRLVISSRFGELSHAEIVSAMAGRQSERAITTRPSRIAGADVLHVNDASLPHPKRRGDYLVRNVNIRVAAHEVLGIFGLMGSGRTELLETIIGLHNRRGSASIKVDERPVSFSSARAGIAAGLAMAPEDRKRDGLILHMSVRENASMACLREIRRWGTVDPRREHAFVAPYLERMQLRAGSQEGLAGTLSGGNQQKVVLAKWLAVKPKVLLLDEP